MRLMFVRSDGWLVGWLVGWLEMRARGWNGIFIEIEMKDFIGKMTEMTTCMYW